MCQARDGNTAAGEPEAEIITRSGRNQDERAWKKPKGENSGPGGTALD
jgi:hypothetical protein